MGKLKLLISTALIAAIAACGGGGGNPGGTSGGGSTSTPASVELITSSNTLQSAAGTVLITGLVKNSSNNVVASQAVTFSSTSGALQNASALTDANGAATVTLSPGADKSNRSIRVTLTAGSVSGFVDVVVIGSQITISGSGSLIQTAGASSYTIKAVDSAGNGIVGATIGMVSTLGNPLSASSAVTNGLGETTVLLTPNTAGTDTLTATGLGAVAQQSVFISGEDFQVLAPGAGESVAIGASRIVTARYRISGVGQAGRTVLFSTTRGTVSPSSAVTNSSGEATTTLASTTSGPAIVGASIAGVAQTNVSVEFIATTPATLVLQANPSAILPNASGSANQATVVATVRDASSNPVKNTAVNFTLQSLSGSLSQGSAITDSNGNAQVSFVSGAGSTSVNGVQLTATVVANPAVLGTTSMTVNGQALFITMGTGNTISNQDDNTYRKGFTVYVTDANGAPVAGKSVVLSIFPTAYFKGSMVYGTSSWGFEPGSPVTCANEDANSNGELNAGEDINGNGRLEPGIPVVISPGTVVTDANGFATFNLLYAESYALWVQTRIRASASVSGTESSSLIAFLLIGMTSDYADEAVPPAGRFSPFGTDLDCSIPPPAVP